jgi:hypothetical protein
MNIMDYGGYYQMQHGGYHSRSSSAKSQAKQAVNLIGRHVKINRGGPDVVEGLLIAVPSDYLVLASAEGIVYVNGGHVKSITEGSKSIRRSRSHRYIAASSFKSLLNKLSHQFIQINRGGPEKVEGFLAEISSQFLLVIAGREFVRVPIFHIKTVNVTTHGHKSGKSGGNKSGGHKSGNKSGEHKSGNKSGEHKSGNKSDHKSSHKSDNRSHRKSGGRHSGSEGNRRSGKY